MFAVIVTAALAAAPAPEGRAQESEHFFQRAQSAYRLRRYDTALEHLLEVYDRSPTPEVRLGVARTAAQARFRELAHAFYRELLEHPQYRAEARSALARLRPRLALVELSSEPPGAEVFVDDRQLGSYGRTPLVLAVSPGRRRIILDADNHHRVSFEVRARKGARVRAARSLSARQGRLRIEVTPSGADIRLERGEARTTTVAAGGEARLAAGTYTARVEAEGYVPEELEVRVRPGALEVRRVTLVPTREAGARVLVSTGGLRAPVRVDGVHRGRAPLVLSLAPGEHEVQVGEGYRRDLMLLAGKSYVLTPEPEEVRPRGPSFD
ncbi:MAG: carboxypeptidase-like regulatory domain-containing protein [Myxococcota bacterium]